MTGPTQHPASNSTARKRAEQAPIENVLNEVRSERLRQEGKWGQQNHPNGAGPEYAMNEDIGAWDDATNAEVAELAKERTDALADVGRCTYAHILTEEFWEALACDDAADLREELIQVAAVAVAWVQKIDRDTSRSAS